MTINYKNIINKIKNNYGLRFILNIAILLLLFLFFYKFLRNYKFINDIYLIGIEKFTYFLLTASRYSLELFGYKVITFGKTIRVIDDIAMHGVYLDRGCMGRNVLLAYSGLILATPGNLKNKLWYIPLGMAIITLVNIIRISGLAIISYCCEEYVDINHHFVFKIAAWIVIFILWVIWFNKFLFSKKRPKLQN